MEPKLKRKYTCSMCGNSYIITGGNTMFECETCCGKLMEEERL